MPLVSFQCRPVFHFSYNPVFCMNDFVCMCDGWVGNSFVLEVNCVGESFFLCGFDVACMRLVVIW